MKIGIFTIVDPVSNGGLEAYIRTLTETLVANGNTVYWNGQEPPGRTDLASVWQPRINHFVRFMRRRLTESLVIAAVSRMERQWFAKATRCLDVAHFVGVGWNLLGFPLVKNAKANSVVRTCWPAIHPGECGDSRFDLQLYKRMNAVFAQSDFEKQYLISMGLQSGRVVRCDLASTVIAKGSTSRFQEQFPTVKNKNIVLFIGRKTAAKGYHALLQAVDDLYRAGEHVLLVSIGRALEPPYQILSPEVHIDLGEANETLKQDALAACSVLAVPSRAESFGLVYTEAWANGKPVICGEAPASRELVSRFNAGLCSTSTGHGLADAIKTLINNPVLAQSLGTAGAVAVEKYLNWEAVAKTHCNTWQQATIDATT